MKTILLIKRGVTAEQGSEEHRLLVLFVCSLLKARSKTVVVGLRGACGLLLSQLACLHEHEILCTDSTETDAALAVDTAQHWAHIYACEVGLHENYNYVTIPVCITPPICKVIARLRVLLCSFAANPERKTHKRGCIF